MPARRAAADGVEDDLRSLTSGQTVDHRIERPSSSSRSASDGFEHLAALFFALPATFEICRDDRICHQGRMPK